MTTELEPGALAAATSAVTAEIDRYWNDDAVEPSHEPVASAAIRAYLSALSAPEAAHPGAEGAAYAHEYGRSNGDGTFSVVIERGEPKRAAPEWPVKPLYAHPTPRSAAPPDGLVALGEPVVWRVLIRRRNGMKHFIYTERLPYSPLADDDVEHIYTDPEPLYPHPAAPTDDLRQQAAVIAEEGSDTETISAIKPEGK